MGTDKAHRARHSEIAVEEDVAADPDPVGDQCVAVLVGGRDRGSAAVELAGDVRPVEPNRTGRGKPFIEEDCATDLNLLGV